MVEYVAILLHLTYISTLFQILNVDFNIVFEWYTCLHEILHKLHYTFDHLKLFEHLSIWIIPNLYV